VCQEGGRAKAYTIKVFLSCQKVANQSRDGMTHFARPSRQSHWTPPVNGTDPDTLFTLHLSDRLQNKLLARWKLFYAGKPGKKSIKIFLWSCHAAPWGGSMGKGMLRPEVYWTGDRICVKVLIDHLKSQCVTSVCNLDLTKAYYIWQPIGTSTMPMTDTLYLLLHTACKHG
jgi:hypothetical protein